MRKKRIKQFTLITTFRTCPRSRRVPRQGKQRYVPLTYSYPPRRRGRKRESASETFTCPESRTCRFKARQGTKTIFLSSPKTFFPFMKFKIFHFRREQYFSRVTARWRPLHLEKVLSSFNLLIRSCENLISQRKYFFSLRITADFSFSTPSRFIFNRVPPRVSPLFVKGYLFLIPFFHT